MLCGRVYVAPYFDFVFKVYMSSSALNWKPLLNAWLARRPPAESSILQKVFDESFASVYLWSKQNLRYKIGVLECNIINQVIDCFFFTLVFHFHWRINKNRNFGFGSIADVIDLLVNNHSNHTGSRRWYGYMSSGELTWLYHL